MSDTWFLALVLLFFAGIGIVLLLWPSTFLRFIQNPLQPDTPLNRVYTRALGVFVCLFMVVISTSMKNIEGFHRNVVIALWTLPLILPTFLWILWRYSPLEKVNRRYVAGEAEEPQWELQMSIAFCSLLTLIVVAAFLLAMRGIYPK
jgi:hypothetical protein